MAKTQVKQAEKEVKKGKITNYGFYPVRVAVFEKDERNINIKIERTYKDKDGNYQNSSSLFIDDIPKLISTLQNIVNDFGVVKSETKEYEQK